MLPALATSSAIVSGNDFVILGVKYVFPFATFVISTMFSFAARDTLTVPRSSSIGDPFEYRLFVFVQERAALRGGRVRTVEPPDSSVP